MSHIDDGLLHAYLDGALYAEDPAEAERVERHLATCDDCRARLEAARGLRAEADVLLEAATPTDLDMPPFETIAARARDRAAAATGVEDDGGRRTFGGDGGVRADGGARGLRRTFNLTRSLAWAASIVIALGMGWWAHELAFQPYGLPQAPVQPVLRDSARESPGALQAAASAGEPAGAEQPTKASGQAPTAAKQPATTQQADATPQATGAPATRPSNKAAAKMSEMAATQSLKVGRAQEPQPAVEQERARRLQAPAAAPPPDATAKQSNAAAGVTPSVARDAVMRGTDLNGLTTQFLTVDQARTWLGGPVYGVEGLNVVRVVPSVAADGARAVTVYQRLSGTDTLGLHQLRPAGGNAFSLGSDVTGVIRDGTLIYTRTALPPDSVQALLRRLVALPLH